MSPLFLQAVAVVTAAFTKEALRKAMGPLDAIPGRSSEARAGMTGVVKDEEGRQNRGVGAGLAVRCL